MKIYDINNFDQYSNSIINIGIFDGMHIGHQKLLQKSKFISQKEKIKNIIITFWPYPDFFFSSFQKKKSINTFKENIFILSKYKIDILIKVNFTKKFSEVNYFNFMEEILVKKIKIKKLIFGYDSKIGKNKKGNFKKLKLYSFINKFNLYKIHFLISKNTIVSSTKIKNMILLGMVRLVNQYLGKPYSIIGRIIKGKKLGRKIKFPTANLKVNSNNKLIPTSGVYAVIIFYNNKYYRGMINIGFKPTINFLSKTLEVHILNFKENIYDENIVIKFIYKVRNEFKFDSLKKLKNQLLKDKKKILTLLDFIF